MITRSYPDETQKVKISPESRVSMINLAYLLETLTPVLRVGEPGRGHERFAVRSIYRSLILRGWRGR